MSKRIRTNMPARDIEALGKAIRSIERFLYTPPPEFEIGLDSKSSFDRDRRRQIFFESWITHVLKSIYAWGSGQDYLEEHFMGSKISDFLPQPKATRTAEADIDADLHEQIKMAMKMKKIGWRELIEGAGRMLIQEVEADMAKSVRAIKNKKG